MASTKFVFRALVAGALTASVGFSAATVRSIKTPFEVVPLWSMEMLDYLTGQRQAACSGANAAKCDRRHTAVCEDVASFLFLVAKDPAAKPARRGPTPRTDAANPQQFELRIRNAGESGGIHHFHAPDDLNALELVFDCNFSGNTACPMGRFQTGRVQRVEVGPAGGRKRDLTDIARVRPDGPIVVPFDAELKASLFDDVKVIYEVRAVAECFSVDPQPVEWTFPVHVAPAADASSPGVLVARLNQELALEFTYRPANGTPIAFKPDWVEHDWGYTFLMQQTILDRQGDWYQLPPRPFPQAVWVHFPGRREESEEQTRILRGDTYTLSKRVIGRRKGMKAVQTLEPGTYVVVAVGERTLEIRPEHPSDHPCGEETPPLPPNPRTYLVDAEQFYDADLHLQLHPAYTRGC
jgi:hypothetical protein